MDVSKKAIPDLYEGNLRPITSLDNGRYDKSSLANSCSITIAPGYPYVQGPIPQYLPPQWAAYTHPEGQLYFYRNSALKITTDAYLYSSEILVKVLFWAKKLEAMLEEKQIPLSETMELYIMIEGNDCAYYFIDHVSKSSFWLESIQSEELGIPHVDSPSHLNLYLEHLYWIHLENFPMYFGGFPVKVVDDLLCVFNHGLTGILYNLFLMTAAKPHATQDQLTSQTSTFLYARSECEQYIKILKLARQNSTDGHQVCVIARLWRQVCLNRFQTHYGQEISRLSRDQAILYNPPQPSRISAVAQVLTFSASDVYLAKLNDLFVDRYVYFAQWQPFIRRCLRGWKRSFWTASAILLFHGILLLIQCSPILAIASASLSFSSLFISAILVHRYERLESDDACAHDVYEHLEAIHSSRFNFQFLAFSYALPSALQLWALVLLGLNSVVALDSLFGPRYAIACGLSIAAILLWFLRITSPSSWNLIPHVLRREKVERDMV
ncbi:hypothetical protein GYMLUDRAFT_92048 [Collybiopsis luxurians FD-317 M1]|nr:hypothetical protein GYMLUDRAFT_92048 [Collybiopsis luxurians FD-317 M1]